MKKIIATFFVWRALLFIPLYLSFLFIPYRLGFDYTNIWKFTKFYTPVGSPLLYPWANFDGVHYLSIAANGYSNDSGFFPLFPVLIKAGSTLLQGKIAFDLGYFLSGFLIANACFGLALWVFYKLLRLDYSEKVSSQTLFILLLFPTSFFFASLYTESLFLLLALLSFYFARQKKWLLASIFTALLSATRIVGIAILPALLYEFWTVEKKLSTKIIPILLSPLGLLVYVFYNYHAFGNAFAFIKAQEVIAPGRTAHPIFFLQTVFRYLKILFTTYGNWEWWIAGLELSSFVFAGVMLYIAWKKKVRLSYLIFSVLTFLVPISSGTFSGLPRYVLILFPMFIALSQIKNKKLVSIYFAISTILLIILLMAFSRGYFVA